MNVILFDGEERTSLLPFTFTRPVAQIRVGILTIAEKWEKLLDRKVSYDTQDYLQKKFPLRWENDNWLINGGICPSLKLIGKILDLKPGTSLFAGDVHVASRVKDTDSADWKSATGTKIDFDGDLLQIARPWHIFQHNGVALEADYKLLTEGRVSQPLSKTNTLIGDRVFLEAGAKVEAAVLNSTSGPIYLGANAEIMEGSVVRGGLGLCDHSALKLGSKIYGPTTIGPHSKVGGEVNNSVIFGYSNKGHDGFLGNAVLGEWCNIGADSNNSNLKNNYDEVKIWNYGKKTFEKTGLQFCGLLMGDHSKCGINTMFNTGTTVGVSANIFGGGFPRTIIPSYSWGGASGFTTYKIDKALETAARVMERRSIPLDSIEADILTHIYEIDRWGL